VPKRLERTNTKVGKTVTLYHRETVAEKTKFGYTLYSLTYPWVNERFSQEVPNFALEISR
jgi:hypothetical protein